jgi:uncharacterized protein (TIGR00299 family) protein
MHGEGADKLDRSIYDGNILYADCFAGIAGDMFLASLIDISEGEEYLRREFEKIPLENYELRIFADKRGGIRGLRFDVVSGEGHGHRHLSDIKEIISGSGLSDNVKSRVINVFTLLAEAEAKVHGDSVEHVHFHEVGAVDSIIDVAGAMIMLEHMGWPQVVFSPLNIGSGTVKCEHGVLPVPAPAAAELLCGIEVFSEGDQMERVTPTGAVLVKALGGQTALGFPAGKILKNGFGLGARDGNPPNLVRVSLIKPLGCALEDICIELSANIDDMTPQDLSFVMDKLFKAGALDVWFENIQMKKNRPAVKLCCLGQKNTQKKLTDVILNHTTTLGVRWTAVSRTVLERRTDDFKTKLGIVRIKSAFSGGRTVKQMPEFEDIRRIAEDMGLTLSEVRAIIAHEDLTLPDPCAQENGKISPHTVCGYDDIKS